MLDRLRFQEIEKAIFRVKEAGQYGDKYLLKDEPFMIIDNASISNFRIGERSKTPTGRSVEADTSTIRSVTFDLSNGQVMLNLFNSIFGNTKVSTNDNILHSVYTINGSVNLIDTDNFELPNTPQGDILLYITDDYGDLTRIASNQYTVENRTVTFVHNTTNIITYVYSYRANAQMQSIIKQLGGHLITSLEMQCIAMDTLTEEKVRLLIKFDRVSVGTNLSINFNNSEKASGSIIYIEGLPEENTTVNKPIFSIDVI
jgi:hypothetical protein